MAEAPSITAACSANNNCVPRRHATFNSLTSIFLQLACCTIHTRAYGPHSRNNRDNIFAYVNLVMNRMN